MKNRIPALLFLLLSTAAPVCAETLAVNADVVNETGCRKVWFIVDPANQGRICDILTDESKLPADARKLKYDGYAFPGLIDTHNHIHYNSIPKWKPTKHFANRYEWNKDTNPGYWNNVHLVYENKIKTSDPTTQASTLYGEIRAIVGGTTMVQSTYKKAPPAVLVRNLTPAEYKVATTTANVNSIQAELKGYRERLERPTAEDGLKRFFLHIGEGNPQDEDSRKEFGILKNNGLIREGMVIIHGTALTMPQFQDMAKNDVSLSWSPCSNINLYGVTTAIPDALDAGVNVALSPDWTISGSNNLLEEMKFADAYAKKHWSKKNPLTPNCLFRMVTTNAAKVAGIDDHLGQLKKEYIADFFLAPRKDADPYVSLLQTNPRDIALVVVGGNAVYGDEEQMKAVSSNFEPITVDGITKQIVLNSPHLPEIEKTLKQEISNVAPIIEP
jgi:hypothetical protein